MTTHAGENADSLQPDDPRELGAYRLLARLGRGGMGTVFLGQDPAGRRVAVKMINRELAGEPAFRERFRREVTAAGQVRRFCTAPVIDAELDREPLYIVTEFIQGPSLERTVAERGPLPGSDLEGLAVGVATALAAIHGAGIVHRDLKPANVLLSATGPRVIDFGIARATDAVDGPTRTGQFIGTPSYLPPELLRGEPVTPASDVFSWGCVVAYAGTGRPPFAGSTVPEIFYKVAHEAPVLDGLDPALRDLVAAALRKDPRQRPSTQELLARLVGTAQPDPAAIAETVQASWPASHPTRTDLPPPPGDPGLPPHPGPPPHPGLPSHGPGTRAYGPGTSTPPTSLRRPGRAGGKRRWTVIGAAAGAAIIVTGLLGWALLPDFQAAGPPAYGKTLIPKDNFDNTGSGWPNSQYSCGAYKDSAYLLQVTNYSSETTCEYPKQEKASTNRYLNDFRMRLEGGPASGQWDAGLYFLKDSSNRYDLVLRPDGSVHLRKVRDSHGVDVKTAKASGFKRKGFNRIQAELDLSGTNTRLAIWVNGDKAIDYTDADQPLRQGTGGLVINRPYQSGDSSNAGATFDDYGVYEVGK